MYVALQLTICLKQAADIGRRRRAQGVMGSNRIVPRHTHRPHGKETCFIQCIHFLHLLISP